MTHGSLFSGIGGFDLATEWIVSHGADTRFEDMPRRAESADAYRHRPNAKERPTLAAMSKLGLLPTPRAFCYKDAQRDRWKSNLGEVIIGQIALFARRATA